jgi:RNA polymerase sigma factor (TIGR02999 family)
VPAARREETTDLLVAWAAGDARAAEALVERLYPELRRLAARRLDDGRREPALDTTELVHEAYLQLVDQRRTDWRSRGHFFAIAARVMRRLVANHERDRRRLKRGGAVHLQALEELAEWQLAPLAAAAAAAPIDLLALDEALDHLERVDAGAARLVELRFYAGLELEEVAAVLGCSRATVVRGWRSARAWLKDRLTAPATGG